MKFIRPDIKAIALRSDVKVNILRYPRIRTVIYGRRARSNVVVLILRVDKKGIRLPWYVPDCVWKSRSHVVRTIAVKEDKAGPCLAQWIVIFNAYSVAGDDRVRDVKAVAAERGCIEDTLPGIKASTGNGRMDDPGSIRDGIGVVDINLGAVATIICCAGHVSG